MGVVSLSTGSPAPCWWPAMKYRRSSGGGSTSRGAVAICVFDVSVERVVAAEPGDAIARGEQTRPGHGTHARGVNHLVPLALEKTTLQPDVRVVSYKRAVLLTCKAPVLARD